MGVSNTTDQVAAAVGLNMQTAAEKQIASAAEYGVQLDVKTTVYLNDGSKAWPSTLAQALCDSPALADGTRQDMADLITRMLNLTKPFNATRLSRKLSAKAAEVARDILKRFGYTPDKLDIGLDIRDTVKAGKVIPDYIESTIRTRFEPDGLWLVDRWYPYERIKSYETDFPWYCFGIRFAGYVIPLSSVLAMRSIGIGQFQLLDTAACNSASADQLARRESLIKS